MKFIRTDFKNLIIINPFISNDERGKFFKYYNKDKYKELGLPTQWVEEYYSVSKKGTIRGMHFQTPPFEHEKIVYCNSGSVLDVVLDLRKNSETYGKVFSKKLIASDGECILIPKGMAHGFMALEDDTIMQYKVTTTYSAENDLGIKWDSFGFDWQCENPIISKRDREHKSFDEFESPF